MLRRRYVLLFVLAVALLVTASSLPAAADKVVLDISHVTDKTLPNGLHVIVKHEPYWGVVGAGLFIRAGGVHNPAGKAGLSHLVEHLLFETIDPSKPGIGRVIESLGGYVNAESLRDFTSIQWLVAARHFDRTLAVVAQAVANLKVTGPELDAEKQVIRREIADRNSDITQIADEQLWLTAYKEHPYRWSVGGTEKSLDSITVQDVIDFHRRFYVANNMALVVVGDMEPEDVFAVAERHLGRLPHREVDWKAPPAEKWPKGVRWRVIPRPARAAVIALGFPAPGMDRPRDVCAMDLLYTLLGQDPTGWLQTVLVRERRLALAASCDFLTRRFPGLLTITAVCTPSKDLAAREAILAKIRDLRRRPVPEQDLATAKTLLATSYAFTNETYVDQVGSIGFYEMIDTYKFAFDYLDIVQSITPEQVQAVARKYLDPDAYAGVVVRPRQSGEREAVIPWPLG